MQIGLRLKLAEELKLEQKIELALAQKLELRPPSETIFDGSVENLQELLKTTPQVKDNALHYLVAGGWAVEMLTGEKREHHDIDVITLKNIPFAYNLDIQKSTRYFQTLSIKPEKMLKKYTTKANLKTESGKKKIVYVPKPEFLFLSKLTGFLREPREKDYEDLKSLSKIIDEKKGVYNKFRDLLGQIPGINRNFQKNKNLFKELGNSIKEGDVKKMAADYILEIIDNYKNGKEALAKKQSSRFHEALKNIYGEGLKDTISANKTNARLALYEKAMLEKKIEGFWTGKDEEIDLRLFPTKRNREYVNHLKNWQNAEKIAGMELISFEEFKEAKSLKPIYLGTTQEKKKLLTTAERTLGLFDHVKCIDNLIVEGECDGEFKFFNMEGEIIAELEGMYLNDNSFNSIYSLEKILLERKRYECVDKIESIKKQTLGEKYEPWEFESVVNSAYRELLEDLRFKIQDAKNLAARYTLDKQGMIIRECYEKLISQERFELANKLDEEIGVPLKELIHQRILHQTANRILEDLEGSSKFINCAGQLSQSLLTELRLLAKIKQLGLENPEKSNSKIKDVYCKVLEKEEWSTIRELEEVIKRHSTALAIAEEVKEFNSSYMKKRIEEARNKGLWLLRKEAILTSSQPVNLSDEDRIDLYKHSKRWGNLDYNFNIISCLPTQTLENLFVEDPEMFMPKDYAKLNIPTNERTKKAAEQLILNYAKSPGRRNINELLTNLNNKFGVKEEELGQRWLEYIAEQIEKRNITSAAKQISHLENTGWIKKESIKEVVRDLFKKHSQEDYDVAAYIARDLLGNAELAKKYGKMYLEVHGPQGSPAIKKAFGI